MNILHIGTNIDSGAGLGMFRLHFDLLGKGIDSHILARYSESSDKRISAFFTKGDKEQLWRLRDMPERILHKLRIHDSDYYRANKLLTVCRSSHAMVSSPFTRLNVMSHPWIREADVIHLHWTACFLDWQKFFPTVKKACCLDAS